MKLLCIKTVVVAGRTVFEEGVEYQAKEIHENDETVGYEIRSGVGMGYVDKDERMFVENFEIVVEPVVAEEPETQETIDVISKVYDEAHAVDEPKEHEGVTDPENVDEGKLIEESEYKAKRVKAKEPETLPEPYEPVPRSKPIPVPAKKNGLTGWFKRKGR